MNKEIIASLQSSELFKVLDEEALTKVSEMVERVSVKAGREIVREGQPSDKLFLIVNGIAAVKKLAESDSEKVLAYLMPGNTFGEVGILEGKPRSATVSALTKAELIQIPSYIFEDLLMKFPKLGIELARLLGHYLTQTNNRISRGNKESRLMAVFNIDNAQTAAKLSRSLAAKVNAQTGKPTIYIHYRDQRNKGNTGVMEIEHHRHFDVLCNWHRLDFPPDSRISIVADRLLNSYDNLVIFFDELPKENLSIIYENLSQAVVVSGDGQWEQAKAVSDQIKRSAVHREVEVFPLMEQTDTDGNAIYFAPDKLNFLSKSSNFTRFDETVNGIVDRLERNNRIGIFIPTTLDVNKAADTSAFVSDALAFMGKKFGGATSEEAIGVWNSKEIGIVDEKVFIVHSYTTSKALKENLNEVVDFVKSMKAKLNQESMALEINKRLTLI